jgi:peptidyl-prolyl cis-trans isomerase-like 6
MANQGYPHTNASQFYITFDKIAAFDRKCVAFGRIVQGLKEFEKLKRIHVQNSIPEVPIVITSCGKF